MQISCNLHFLWKAKKKKSSKISNIFPLCFLKANSHCWKLFYGNRNTFHRLLSFETGFPLFFEWLGHHLFCWTLAIADVGNWRVNKVQKEYILLFLSYKDQEKNFQSISNLENIAFTLNSMTKKQSIIMDFFQPKLQDSLLNVLKWS